MKASELRQSILQAAVQGKLVSQDLHDEPASELLERIRVEKAKLIKEGKIKKEKPLSPITEDEVPYDLPEGWVWCRLIEISIIGTGSTPLKGNSDYYKNGTIPWIMSAATNEDMVYATDVYITEKALNENHLEINPIGTLLMAMYGQGKTRGQVSELAIEATTNQACATINLMPSANKNYVKLYLKKIYMEIRTLAEGGAQPNLNLNKIKSYAVPLPPISEQQRIINKADELMALCDELEAVESQLETLENHFIEYLPKSILQLAVQGKLVPQNLHDESASELLERIHAEKAKLVKEGNLKKEKPLPPITEEEIPYDLPEGWVWCRLGEIHNIQRGITFPATVKHKTPQDGLVCCATTGSVQATYNPDADVFVPEQYVKNDRQWLQMNDIIMSTANSRELVGKSCLWTDSERKTFGGFLTVIRPIGDLLSVYSYYCIQYLWKAGAFITSATQTTNIANINNDILNATLFPLPPVAEQQRIINKVSELMTLCEKLKLAKSEPIKTIESNVVPFPQLAEPAEGIGIAARGDATQPYSPKLQGTIGKLFEDKSDE